MQPEWFEEFAKQILKEKGVNAPDEAVEKQLISDISTTVRDVVLRDLLDALTEAELEKLHAAIDSDDAEAAQAMMADKQPIVTESLTRFKIRYLGKA